MANLTDYRSDLDNLLGTAVDTTTWSSTMKDEALRQALIEYSLQGPVYETDFTVVTTGYEQDLSTIADLIKVEEISYPWVEGAPFYYRGGPITDLSYTRQGITYRTRWRPIGVNVIYFENVEPAAGETIRVRYRKQHYIENLDSAGSTTVPDVHRRTVGLRAAVSLIQQRLRQISENPAIPRTAEGVLEKLYAEYMKEYIERLIAGRRNDNPVWSGIGL